MKKHISQLIFLLVGMMIFISCDLGHQKPKSSQKTIEMDFKRYKDAKKDLSVELPKTWEVHIIKSEEKGDQNRGIGAKSAACGRLKIMKR